MATGSLMTLTTDSEAVRHPIETVFASKGSGSTCSKAYAIGAGRVARKHWPRGGPLKPRSPRWSPVGVFVPNRTPLSPCINSSRRVGAASAPRPGSSPTGLLATVRTPLTWPRSGCMCGHVTASGDKPNIVDCSSTLHEASRTVESAWSTREARVSAPGNATDLCASDVPRWADAPARHLRLPPKSKRPTPTGL